MAAEKRSQEPEECAELKENILVVDIEGTTTSISFVKETLFPYVREHLREHIDAKWEDEEFKEDFKKLKEQADKDAEDKVEGVVAIVEGDLKDSKDSVCNNVLWQMDNDRKTGALKQLQGHMWREAYKSGAVKGHVYEDVPEALKSWTEAGRTIYVYSSGSVEAQKLLFGHSTNGDLLKFFKGHFDTEVGGKQDEKSYKNILSKIEAEASNVVFLTDVVKEAEAAKSAGIRSILVMRDGNAPLTDADKASFTTISSFLDLSFQSSAKRQKVEEPENGKTEDVEMTEASDKKDTEKIEETPKPEVVEESSSEKKEQKLEKSEIPVVDAPAKADKVEKMEVSETESSVKRKEDEKVDSEETVKEKVEEKIEKPVANGGEEKTEVEEQKVAEKIADDELPIVPDEPEESACKKPIDEPKEAAVESTTPAEAEKKPVEETAVEEPVKSDETSCAKVVETTEKTEETKPEEKVAEQEETKSETKESTDAKVNGTAQNGDSEVKGEEKTHENGNGVVEKTVETEESSEGKKDEVQVAQNGDSEAIKVKKVVEPTIAEESEPAVVAATS